GQLTFAFNGPSADDIQVDGNEQDLMDFTITAENWTTIKEMDVLVVSTTNDGSADDALVQNDGDLNLQNIAIREADGTTWMGPEDLSGSGDDGSQTVTFTDDQTMQAGESVDLMVTADVDAQTPAGEVYHVVIDMGSVMAEDANGDDLATGDVVPSADITGHNFTTVDSSMTVTASTPPSDGSFVKGATGVSVVGFNFEAGNASDVTVTDVTYLVTGDSDGVLSGEQDIDVGDHVSQCSLYDSESGSLVDGPESPTDNSGDANLEFQNFDWTVAAGETAKLIMKCDFSNSTLDDSSGSDDAYAFGIASEDDIVAEDEDGQDVSVGALAEDNTDGAEATITITDAGSLTVSLDGSTANSTIILGSSTGVSMSKFKFDATDEPFVVKHLELENCVMDSGDDMGDYCGDEDGTYGSDDAAATVKISYTNSAGATETKSGFLSGGYVSFDGLDIYVPTESTRTVTVTVDTNSVSSTGAASGDQIQLNFDALNSEFEATGDASGETIDETTLGSYVIANAMTLHKTKPTLSLASGSPSGAGVPSDSEVFRFNVAADSRGFVTLDQVLFKVVTSDGDGDFNTCDDFASDTKFTFYDVDDSSEKLDDAADWTFVDDSGDECVDGGGDSDVLSYAILDFTGSATHGSEEIGAGETKTYVLKVDTLGADSDDNDAIRIDVPDQDEADDVDGGVNAITWDDDSEGSNFDGTLIKNLSITGGTIQY
ncbi:hypothetical protein EBS80_02040, partial [bacterium]|nr:hypothetical protein [bacterium]